MGLVRRLHGYFKQGLTTGVFLRNHEGELMCTCKELDVGGSTSCSFWLDMSPGAPATPQYDPESLMYMADQQRSSKTVCLTAKVRRSSLKPDGRDMILRTSTDSRLTKRKTILEPDGHKEYAGSIARSKKS